MPVSPHNYSSSSDYNRRANNYNQRANNTASFKFHSPSFII